MPNKRPITSATMTDLAKVAERCERWAPSPLSNTKTRALAKLGWIEVRVVRIYGTRSPCEQAPASPTSSHFNARLTDAGRAALATLL